MLNVKNAKLLAHNFGQKDKFKAVLGYLANGTKNL